MHRWKAKTSAVVGLLVLALTLAHPASAQDDGTYTVVPGDTLSAIAAQYGVPLDALVAVNGIRDPNNLVSGQVLTIPNQDGTLPASRIETSSVRAVPGDTIATVATRLGQPARLIADLNGMDVASRLFPGQPVNIPAAALPIEPYRFGSVTGIDTPSTIMQGRTGRVYVATDRPLVLTAYWFNRPVVFTPISITGRRQFAFLPVDPLQEPGTYDLIITYTTRRGVPVTSRHPITIVEGPYDYQDIVVAEAKAAQLTPDVVQAERERVTSTWSEVSTNLLWLDPFQRPISLDYATTSPFGTRRTYSVSDIGNYHAGQDFGAPEGVLVTAPAPGEVVLAEPLAVRGNAVIVDHGRGVFTGYWHLSAIAVEPGQMVSPGDVIGLVGNTGLSTGAHLHWELRINGVAVDPMQFLEEVAYTP